MPKGVEVQFLSRAHESASGAGSKSNHFDLREELQDGVMSRYHIGTDESGSRLLRAGSEQKAVTNSSPAHKKSLLF